MKNPIKPNLKSEFFSLLLIALSIIFSIWLFTSLPAQIPVHWNFAGEVDKMGSSLSIVLGMPGLLLSLYILFLALPLLDPKKERYIEFRKVYHTFKTIIISLIFILYLLVGLNGLGHNMPISIVVPILIGLLFIILGNYLGKVKPNWFVGIKTPWTLSSEEVWNKTHRLGGKTFILAGILLMLEPVFPPSWRVLVFVILLVIAVIVPIAYSFILYKKQSKK